ncbi:MAG: tRNA 2-thiouridine(34) synthase MnmA, partial [Alloprevotella tannerae]|nr:tRNA 2-thiouridine(34) synthase MnmA [Alloprevotella tannerae]
MRSMKTAALISGGVDSAVAVHLLKEQGITPDLFYIKIGNGPQGEWDCKAEEDWERATAVARRYGCKLQLIDLQKEYWDEVVGYIIDRLRKGLTPNSDVMCNKYIKFGCFE